VDSMHLARKEQQPAAANFLASCCSAPSSRLSQTHGVELRYLSDRRLCPVLTAGPTQYLSLYPYCTIPCFPVVSDKDSKFIYDFEEHKSLTERSEQKALRLRFQRVAALTSQKDRFSESAASRWESVGTATSSQFYR
jgi:hypothetical protein